MVGSTEGDRAMIITKPSNPNMLLAMHHASGVSFANSQAEKRWRVLEAMRLIRLYLAGSA